MRRMRKSRPGHVAAGALILAVPGSAVALAAGQADAQSAIQLELSSRHVPYGEAVTVSGDASTLAAGQPVGLEFAPSGSSTWQPIATTRARVGGSFTFHVRLRESGLLRAVQGATVASTGKLAAVPSFAGLGQSTPREIDVSPRFVLDRGSHDVLSGQTVVVRGRMLPGVAGRRVRLEGRLGGGWHVLARARTERRGGFELRYSTTGLGNEPLRVVFAGDRLNASAAGRAGRLEVFRQSLASWYYDGGNTACGFHAGMGVANRVLPCGTRVTFRYGGRTVTAVVDDRGPFVGGREWDLNQNTAGALGFAGVGTVWSTA